MAFRAMMAAAALAMAGAAASAATYNEYRFIVDGETTSRYAARLFIDADLYPSPSTLVVEKTEVGFNMTGYTSLLDGVPVSTPDVRVLIGGLGTFTVEFGPNAAVNDASAFLIGSGSGRVITIIDPDGMSYVDGFPSSVFGPLRIVQTTQVPVPATAGLSVLALAALGFLRRR